MKKFNMNCLHCVVAFAIHSYFERRPRNEDGKVVFDGPAIIEALAANVGELIAATPSRPERRRSTKFAHDALDAAVKAAITGKLQSVAVGHLETEH